MNLQRAHQLGCRIQLHRSLRSEVEVRCLADEAMTRLERTAALDLERLITPT